VSKQGWDLTSLRSLDAGAEWMRKRAGACLVLVVRANAEAETHDVAFAVDPLIAAKDAVAMVEVAMPEIADRLEAIREAAKEAARCKAVRDQQKAAAAALKGGKR
jgi:hypothetical protein